MNKTILFFFIIACSAAAAFAYTQSDLEDAMDMLSQQQEVQDYSDYSDSSSSSDEEVSDMDNDMFFRSVFRAVGRAFRSFTSGGLSGILGRVGGLLSGGSDLFGRIGGLVSGGKSFLGSLGGLFKKGGGSFFDKLGGVFNQGRDYASEDSFPEALICSDVLEDSFPVERASSVQLWSFHLPGCPRTVVRRTSWRNPRF
eukprot:TRINITY_DN18_c0_g1_i8.p1 TRINITY_DN18_c0_g1~~TRINITY_DN18_c0_g1_i8.p1  ORF type:complete len:212 (+),score=37.74 TRINITY_DN18_c0_g1_i8:45-638(+)